MRSLGMLAFVLVGCGSAAPATTVPPARTDECTTGASVPVSTEPHIVEAAQAAAAFRASLDAAQLAQASFCLEETELYAWSNLPPNLAPREGLPLGSLTPAQLQRAYAMLDVFLSASGYDRVRFIVNTLDPYLLAQDGNPAMFGSGLYRLSLFNDPVYDGAWGVQIDGHHLAITFVVDGDQVHMTPAFFGADPRVYEGVRVFDVEERAAFDFVDSLSSEELAAARLADEAPEDVLSAPGDSGLDAARDADFGRFAEGLAYARLNEAARAKLRALVAAALAYQSPPWLDRKLASVDATLAQAHFVWMGLPSSTRRGTSERFYFRVYSPAVLIEFDLTWNADHAHMVVRSPDGSDYGGLLAHYRSSRHDL